MTTAILSVRDGVWIALPRDLWKPRIAPITKNKWKMLKIVRWRHTLSPMWSSIGSLQFGNRIFQMVFRNDFLPAQDHRFGSILGRLDDHSGGHA
jgi:hypothetical protein